LAKCYPRKSTTPSSRLEETVEEKETGVFPQPNNKGKSENMVRRSRDARATPQTPNKRRSLKPCYYEQKLIKGDWRWW